MNEPEAPNDAREIVVFVSYDNSEPPKRLAERMLAELKLASLAVGVDVLTSGSEVRLFYHPETLAAVVGYLREHRIVHDIAFL